MAAGSLRFAVPTAAGAIAGFLLPWAGSLFGLSGQANLGLTLALAGTGAAALGTAAFLSAAALERMGRRADSVESILGSILELSGQGYLVCGPDLVAEPLHSASCQALLGQDPTGQKVPDLLWTGESQREDFRAGLALIFSKKTAPEVIFDLLETQAEVGEKVLRLQYRALPGPRVLVALTDVSLERREEARVQEENDRRSILLKVVSQRASFSSLSRAASLLFDQLGATELVDLDAASSLALSRDLHTLKANAAFFEFRRTATAAHEFEEHLSDSRVFGQEPDLRGRTLNLKRAYFADLHMVTDVLGEQWLVDADAVAVPKPLLLKLESHLKAAMPEDRIVLPLLRRFRTVPFRDLFVRFPDLAASLAERLGKTIHPVLVEGGDFPVLPEKFSALTDVLVHLVRNLVDHGIEPPLQRQALGKDPAGLIQIKINREAGALFLVFSDDGHGIDLAAVQTRAVELGLLGSRERPSEDRLLGFLFAPGFSTAAEVTEVSGRGLGLDAVRQEVLRLGGTLTVNTRLGRGTSFDILIPVKINAARAGVLQEV